MANIEVRISNEKSQESLCKDFFDQFMLYFPECRSKCLYAWKHRLRFNIMSFIMMIEISANEGFKTKANAEKISKLVIEKIKKVEMPPNITIEEMEKINVL